MLSNITVFPRPKNVLLDGGCFIFHHLTTLDNTYRMRNINKKPARHRTPCLCRKDDWIVR